MWFKCEWPFVGGGGGRGGEALCDETKTAVRETTEGRNVILNKYSLKSRWIVAEYLPRRESGEVNIPKATIHRDWKE